MDKRFKRKLGLGSVSLHMMPLSIALLGLTACQSSTTSQSTATTTMTTANTATDKATSSQARGIDRMVVWINLMIPRYSRCEQRLHRSLKPCHFRIK